MHNIYIYRFRYPHPLKINSSMSDMSILKPFRFGARVATLSHLCEQVDIEDKVDRLERIIVTCRIRLAFVDGW